MDEWLKKSLDQKFAEQRSLKATQKDETLKNFGCQNKKCAKYGILGCSNIRVRASYGKNNTRLLHCTRCGQAVTWLQDFLASGERPAKEIYETAEANGIKKRTLGSAKKELDVKARLEGFGKDGIWYWSLPFIAIPPDADNSCNLCEEPRDCKNAKTDETLENKEHEQK